jgi:hypothetical protein
LQQLWTFQPIDVSGEGGERLQIGRSKVPEGKALSGLRKQIFKSVFRLAEKILSLLFLVIH